MSANYPVGLFDRLLSVIRVHEERVMNFYAELGEHAQDAELRGSLNAMAALSDTVLGTIDQCFSELGQKPSHADDRMLRLLIDDFRAEINELDSPSARAFLVCATAKNLVHLRVGEYQACIAMCEMAGHPGAGFLLQSCLSQKIAFAERTGGRLRRIVEREKSR